MYTRTSLFATSNALLVLCKAGAIGNANTNYEHEMVLFPPTGDDYHIRSRNVLFLMMAVLPNQADCVTMQKRYNTSSNHLSAHFSPLKSHFARLVGNLLPFAVPKGFLYHLIGMLKCFPKRISQSKCVFEHFSPRCLKIIQYYLDFFIATRVRNVAKVLRRTYVVLKGAE